MTVGPGDRPGADAGPDVPAPDEASHGRRWLIVGAACALAVAGLIVAWIFVRGESVSPRQAAAEAAPPPHSPVTAAVERRVLRESLVVRGDVTGDSVTTVVATAPPGYVPVITDAPLSSGDPVTEGQVLTAVAGRPVIALGGDIPLYRDLRPDDVGADVALVQTALERLGADIPASESGNFGPRTQGAVADLWRSVGYEPATTGAEEQAALDAAQAAVAAAQDTYDNALADPSGGEDTARALAALQASETARDAARARIGFRLPRAEVAIVATLPAVVLSVAAGRGSVAADGEPVLTLATADLVVRAPLDALRAQVLQVGMPGTLELPGSGPPIALTLARIDPAGTSGGATGEPQAVFIPTSPLPLETVGENLEVRVDTVVGSDQPVLAVPITAIRSDGDADYVLVDRTGSSTRQTVETGVVAGGWVEVRSAADHLAVGDRVVVEGS